jgi:hypothetical protein
MRRFTPLALVATVVSAFIVAKGCLPKQNLGTKAASSVAPLLPGDTTTAPMGDPPARTAPPR